MENSRLSKLPRELRDMIYAVVLVRNEPISIDFDTPSPGLVLPDQRNILAITSTCKEIRQECSNIFWSKNEFIFELWRAHRDGCDGIARLVTWLRRLGYDRARSIRHVKLACKLFSSDIYYVFWTMLAKPLAPIANFSNRTGIEATLSVDIQYHLGYDPRELRSERIFVPVEIPLTDCTAAKLEVHSWACRYKEAITYSHADHNIPRETHDLAQSMLESVVEVAPGFVDNLRINSKRAAALVFPRERSMEIPKQSRVVVLKLGRESLKRFPGESPVHGS